MRIISFNIDNYKVIKNFSLDFDYEHSASVIVGKNGSGKTTFIECLTTIFTSIFKCDSITSLKEISFPFNFEIKYLLRKEESIETTFHSKVFVDFIGIQIKNSSEGVDIELYYADESFSTFESIEKFLRGRGESVNYLFPDNLVLYYSGISDVLYENFKRFQDEVILGILDGESKIDQQ